MNMLPQNLTEELKIICDHLYQYKIEKYPRSELLCIGVSYDKKDVMKFEICVGNTGSKTLFYYDGNARPNDDIEEYCNFLHNHLDCIHNIRKEIQKLHPRMAQFQIRYDTQTMSIGTWRARSAYDLLFETINI